MNYAEHGLFVPYIEKIQAGLSITDCRGDTLYQYNYPQHLYPDFAAIPPVMVNSLLFIENRDLLDPGPEQPGRGLAALRQGRLQPGGQVPGTARPVRRRQHPGHAAGKIPPLARRPDGVGRGKDPPDDFCQRARLPGRAGHHRSTQRIVRDYLNSVPLSAVPGHGEVHGMAEGLRVWYGADFDQVNQALNATATDPSMAGAAWPCARCCR
jgi:membrane peptidoglycan carboxypeptidase